MSKINGADIEPVDIITFGSPCQDLSVAGKRAGLKHEATGDEETTRSGLFLEAIRIIKEMREATNGVYPTFAVFENVTGAFSSSKGEDFRTVLNEFVHIVEPGAEVPPPPNGKWAYADILMGDGWSIAYRTFDAQYWGVPQRRRRIYLVADFRGERAGKILFKSGGLRGHYAPRREAREGTAADLTDGSGTADSESVRGVGINGDIAGTLDASYYKGCGMREGKEREVVAMPYTMKIRQGVERDSAGKKAGKGPLISENLSMTLGVSQDQYLFQPHIVYSIGAHNSEGMKSSNPQSGIYEADTARTIDANGGNPACYQGGMVVLEGNGSRPSHRGDGWSESDVMYTPNTVDRHSVAYAIDQQGGKGGANYAEEVMPTLCSDSHGTPHAVAYGIDRAAFNQGKNAQYDPKIDKELSATLVSRGPNAVAYAPIGGGLNAVDYKGASRQYVEENKLVVEEDNMEQRYIVRRLTPLECCRLQGFPDGWGETDHKEDFADEEFEFWLDVRNTHGRINGKAVRHYTKAQMVTWYNKLHTDSAEYKMWGNGIALPCARYVMQGIVEAVKEEKNNV